jgi:Replicative DNA helicase
MSNCAIMEIMKNSAVGVKMETFKDVVERYLSQMKRMNKILHSGFDCLDQRIDGFMAGELIVIASRPGIGKSAFALNIAYKMASQDRKVLFFTLDTSNNHLLIRLYSILTGIPVDKIRNKQLGNDDLKKIKGLKKVNALDNILPIDRARYLFEITELIKDTSPDVVIIDYLQLIKTGDAYQLRYQELSDITAELKFLAKNLNTPIILLSQLSRDVEKKSDKKPSLSDLQGSTDIEAIADKVILLSENAKTNTIEVIVAKNRNGDTGSAEFVFNKETLTFKCDFNIRI